MKILKLFPVAFAAFALASCSNDELFSLGAEEQGQKDPNHLYVSVEELKDGEGTRSGFVYNYNALENPNGQYFAFTKDDVVKLYDSENNWRPQYWAFSASATETSKYAKSTGFSVFTENVTDATEHGVKKVNGAQFTNAYGVLPAGLSVFTNETRTKLKFDFDMLKYYSLDQVAVTNDGYDDGKLAKAPIPMWGVANGQEMKVKYLTGILKVDISNVQADADPNTHSFLIVQSTDGTNGYKMHPSDLAEVPYNPEPDANGDFKAPEVKTQSTGATATTIASLTAVKLDRSDVAGDMIIIDLGNVSGRTCIAVPLMAADGAQKVSAYLATNKTAVGSGVTTVDLSGATQIGATKTWTVEASSYYRIMDNAVFDVTGVNTLNELAKKIKELDNSTDRDFTMNLADNVNVQGGDDPEGYTLTLQEALKHNVTLSFGSGMGFKKIGTEHSLVIKTKENADATKAKVLTINNTTASTIVTIEIDATSKDPVILDGTLKTIVNRADDVLTVKNTVDNNIQTYGSMKYDALGKEATIVIHDGTDKLSLLNGVNVITFGTEKFTENVEIYTEGATKVNTVDFSNVKTSGTGATLDWDGNVKFTSKLTEIGYGYGDLTTIVGVNGVTSAIVTALQLKFNTYSANTRILASELDLNGDKFEWAPLNALSYGLDGNSAFLPTGSTKSVTAVPVNIKNLKFVPAAQAGLFKSVGAVTVNNLKFTNTKVEGAAVANAKIGVLAGEVTGEAVIDNIEVTGLEAAPTKSNIVMSIGAVAGQVSTTTDATFKNVKTAGTITAYGNLGGIVGNLTATGKVIFGVITTSGTTYKVTDVCAPNVTITEEKVNTNNSPFYAKFGQYVGAVETTDASSVCGVTINLNSYTETAPTNVDEKAKADFMNTNHETTYHAIGMNQNLIGFSGFFAGSTLPITWTAVGQDKWTAIVNVFGHDFEADAASKRIKYATAAPATTPSGYTHKILCTVAE